MTREQIEAIQKLAKKATPGPWWAQREYDGGRTVCNMRHQTETVCVNRAVHVKGNPWDAHWDNANLIQELRNNVEALCAMALESLELRADKERLLTARPYSEWHEDFGAVLWHMIPIQCSPYVGDPLCCDWPFKTKHNLFWTPLPDCNAIQDLFDAARRRT